MTQKNDPKLFRPKNKEEVNEFIKSNPPLIDYEELSKQILHIKDEFGSIRQFCKAFVYKSKKEALTKYPSIANVIEMMDIMPAIEDQNEQVLETVLTRVIISYVLASLTGFNYFIDKADDNVEPKASFIPLYATLYKKFDNPNFIFAIRLAEDFIDIKAKNLKEHLIITLLGASEKDFKKILENYCNLFLLLGAKLSHLIENNPEKDFYPKTELIMAVFNICFPKIVKESVQSYNDNEKG